MLLKPVNVNYANACFYIRHRHFVALHEHNISNISRYTKPHTTKRKKENEREKKRGKNRKNEKEKKKIIKIGK